MQAIVHTRYGSPDVLKLETVEAPAPKDDEVLVKLEATSVNRMDCGFLRGKPLIVRFFSGALRPKRTILGSEFAGVVEAVGRDVSSFREGDQVFGHTGAAFGAQAEYLTIREGGAIATKPATTNWDEAAGVCDGMMMGLAQIRGARLRRGQSILVYGASGSIGSATVQLAAHFGAEVTAVCEGKDAELLTSLGAADVIDRTRRDFTTIGRTFDVVLDAVGKSSFFRCKDLIKADGCYLTTDLGFLAQNPVLVLWTKAAGGVGGRRVLLPIPKETRQDVVFLSGLLEAGTYRAVIDRRYRLAEIADAYRYVETGQKVGNVVVLIGADP